MSKHIFTLEQIERLKSNPCVKECSSKCITYTEDFKIRAIEQHRNGTSPKEIFRRAGIELVLFAKDHPKECLKRWRRILRKSGKIGLESKGRPRVVTEAEKIKRLELQVAYLKAENDFLVKLRAKRTE